jgi:hypothetical protein
VSRDFINFDLLDRIISKRVDDPKRIPGVLPKISGGSSIKDFRIRIKID